MTGPLPAATLPIDPDDYSVEVQPNAGVGGPNRQRVPVSALAGTGAPVTTEELTVEGNASVEGYQANSIAVGLTAVGTDRATALQLAAQGNIVATAASAAVGVNLPDITAIGPIGAWVDVYNDGPANAFHVYALGSNTIDAVAGATGVNIALSTWTRFVKVSASNYKSFPVTFTR
jgi:hypothetical protein